jgi:hypothetical protein
MVHVFGDDRAGGTNEWLDRSAGSLPLWRAAPLRSPPRGGEGAGELLRFGLALPQCFSGGFARRRFPVAPHI